ncbi:hypothetical protein BGZ70_004342 [Mortierella alpina]|uniref:Ion transport domain-containing protein n=1 Tax=Mortierella alpina TaxID=64518 RepID=A0A9P6M4V3_MORAP|nr:hypothetical protein BGZ70_004342 [Mortierella alpina]
MLWNYEDNPEFEISRPRDNTLWKTLYHMLTIKLRPKAHTYINCHDFNLEVFDNPAIAALALKHGKTYRTIYNLLDIMGYTVPVGTSIQQIVVLYENNPDGYTKTLSFAVLIVFLHAGGRYDDVDDEFESEAWEFHVMMGVYFFFTVIVMLNVLIDTWRLVWIESRLRYTEAAENMSYHVPGFRQSHNWFPKEVFYSATLQEVKAYLEKYHSKESKNQNCEILQDWERDEEYDEDEEGNPITASSQNQQDEDVDKEVALVQELRGQVERLQRNIDEQARLQKWMHEESKKESQKQFKILQELLRSRAQ